MRTLCRWRMPVLALLCLLATVATVSAQTAAIVDKDNVEGPNINLNFAPVRPFLMATVGTTTNLYAVNSFDNTVEVFPNGGPTSPTAVYSVPWGPVSIATWTDGTGALELLVVCRGSDCLTRLDAATGRVKSTIDLPAEPADILVDDTLGRAWVSCPGADSVVEIILATGAKRIYSEATNPLFRMKRPTFLSFQDSVTLGRRILVAPLLSGNNSTPEGGSTPNATGSIYDAEGTTTPFPDEDLFRINPISTVAAGVEVLAVDMGTVLFAHGVHPLTKRFWQLNTEANNKDASAQSEPAVKGKFVNNRINIIDISTATVIDGTDDASSVVAILDSYTNDVNQSAGLGGMITDSNQRTVGQPYALTFHPTNGKVFVAGLLTDNIMVLDQNGAFVNEWKLPDGSIPRGLMLDSSGTVLLVYCWGSNKVLAYRWNKTTPSVLKTLDLRYDPTPANIAKGRELFYDGSRSEHGNISCASCHVDGTTDLLSWNLSNPPLDDKGPMLTQTLFGLDRLAPFHWRGERTLSDFNGAFVGLLGASQKLDGQTELPDFEAFVFSLQVPANPVQDRDRLINDSIQADILGSPTGVSAVAGQNTFRNTPTFGTLTCNECHAAPTGTNNDINRDFSAPFRPRRATFKVAPFHDLQLKRQSRVNVLVPSAGGVLASSPRGFLGASIAHAGVVSDLFGFVVLITGNVPFGNQNGWDITSFINQWDTGLAPAVHFAQTLNAQTTTAQRNDIIYLARQAAARNCGLVAFGTSVNSSGSLAATRWFYNRVSRMFEADQVGFTPRPLSTFLNSVSVEDNCFFGVPVGMAERIGVDFDMDGIRNGGDSFPLTPGPLNALDLTPPGFDVAPHVAFVTTKVARLSWSTNEPARSEIRYREVGSGAAYTLIVRNDFTSIESVILNDLRPSTIDTFANYVPETVAYEWNVKVFDRNGNNQVYTSPPNIVTDPFIKAQFNPGSPREVLELGAHKVISTSMTSLSPPSAGVRSTTVTVQLAMKRGKDAVTNGPAPAINRFVVGRILVKKAGTDTFVNDPATYGISAGSNTAIISDVVLVDNTGAAHAVDGMGNPKPILLSEHVSGTPHIILSHRSTGAGSVSMNINIAGLTTGDTVAFNVEAVIEIPSANIGTYDANFPQSPLLISLNKDAGMQWSFPDSGETRTTVTVDVP